MLVNFNNSLFLKKYKLFYKCSKYSYNKIYRPLFKFNKQIIKPVHKNYYILIKKLKPYL